MYIYIYIYHQIIQIVQCRLTLSRHLPLSSIAPDKSSRLHPVSAQHWCVSMTRSIEEHRLWIPSDFSINAQHSLLVLLGWFRRWKHIYIYIYIYILSSSNRLLRCITNFQWGETREMLQPGIETLLILRLYIYLRIR